MSKRRIGLVVSAITLCSLLLFGYQNCADQSAISAQDGGSSSGTIKTKTCDSSPVLGAWEFDDGTTQETLTFNDDCKGSSVMCQATFEFPEVTSRSGNIEIDILTTAGGTGCLPLGKTTCSYNVSPDGNNLTYNCGGMALNLVRVGYVAPISEATGVYTYNTANGMRAQSASLLFNSSDVFVAGIDQAESAMDQNGLLGRFGMDGATRWVTRVGTTSATLSSHDRFQAHIVDGDNLQVFGASEGITPAGVARNWEIIWVKVSALNGFVNEVRRFGNASNQEVNQAIKVGADYIVVGRHNFTNATNTDGFIIKINSATSAMTWARVWGTGVNDTFNAVAPTPDGGYLVAGRTGSDTTPRYNGLVIKYNADGSIAWAKQIMGGNFDENIQTIQLVSDGYVLGGSYQTASGVNDFMAVKISLDGNNVLWAKYYMSPDQDNFGSSALAGTNVVFAGRSLSSTGTATATLMKINSANGDIDRTLEMGKGSGREFILGREVLFSRPDNGFGVAYSHAPAGSSISSLEVAFTNRDLGFKAPATCSRFSSMSISAFNLVLTTANITGSNVTNTGYSTSVVTTGITSTQLVPTIVNTCGPAL